MVETLRSVLPPAVRRHLTSARELAHRHATISITITRTTTVGALDELLGGGLQRGQMVELVGHRSSGRFSTVLATIAATTGRGEAAALVDLGDGFAPQPAQTAGVVLEHLLWVRPPHLKQALHAAETLLNGGFPLVVVDLGDPPVPGGRGGEAAWLRLARAAQDHRAVLLVASPYRVGGTAAAGVIQATRGRARWSDRDLTPPLLLGLSSRLTLEKLRGHLGTHSETLHLVTSESVTFGTATTPSIPTAEPGLALAVAE